MALRRSSLDGPDSISLYVNGADTVSQPTRSRPRRPAGTYASGPPTQLAASDPSAFYFLGDIAGVACSTTSSPPRPSRSSGGHHLSGGATGIDSGESTSGTVLTADGTGGSSWSTVGTRASPTRRSRPPRSSPARTASAHHRRRRRRLGRPRPCGDPADDTLVWMPLTTVTGGVPELVWDADDT